MACKICCAEIRISVFFAVESENSTIKINFYLMSADKCHFACIWQEVSQWFQFLFRNAVEVKVGETFQISNAQGTILYSYAAKTLEENQIKMIFCIVVLLSHE